MLKPNYDQFVCRIHLSLRGHRDKQGKFDWTSAVLDALIITGITFLRGLVLWRLAPLFLLRVFVCFSVQLGPSFWASWQQKEGLYKKPLGAPKDWKLRRLYVYLTSWSLYLKTSGFCAQMATTQTGWRTSKKRNCGKAWRSLAGLTPSLQTKMASSLMGSNGSASASRIESFMHQSTVWMTFPKYRDADSDWSPTS